MTWSNRQLAIAAAVVGGGALAWWMLRGDEDVDDDGERNITDAGLVAEARALLPTGDAGELAARILAAAPQDGAAAYAAELGIAASRYRLDPLLLVALGDRESGWGFAPPYTPKGGPDGVGDRAPRRRYSPPKVAALVPLYTPNAGRDSSGRAYGTLRPPTWSNGATGFGLGLMQIDAEWNWDWATAGVDGKPQWMDAAANIDKGAAILRGCLDAMGGNVRAALAAYNAGVTSVKRALAAGLDVDSVTTGRDYSSAVAGRFLELGGDGGALT
jgi:hypothetical protein